MIVKDWVKVSSETEPHYELMFSLNSRIIAEVRQHHQKASWFVYRFYANADGFMTHTATEYSLERAKEKVRDLLERFDFKVASKSALNLL